MLSGVATECQLSRCIDPGGMISLQPFAARRNVLTLPVL